VDYSKIELKSKLEMGNPVSKTNKTFVRDGEGFLIL
jgi:hypothetical protein